MEFKQFIKIANVIYNHYDYYDFCSFCAVYLITMGIDHGLECFKYQKEVEKFIEKWEEEHPLITYRIRAMKEHCEKCTGTISCSDCSFSEQEVK